MGRTYWESGILEDEQIHVPNNDDLELEVTIKVSRFVTHLPWEQKDDIVRFVDPKLYLNLFKTKVDQIELNVDKALLLEQYGDLIRTHLDKEYNRIFFVEDEERFV